MSLPTFLFHRCETCVRDHGPEPMKPSAFIESDDEPDPAPTARPKVWKDARCLICLIFAPLTFLI